MLIYSSLFIKMTIQIFQHYCNIHIDLLGEVWLARSEINLSNLKSCNTDLFSPTQAIFSDLKTNKFQEAFNSTLQSNRK